MKRFERYFEFYSDRVPDLSEKDFVFFVPKEICLKSDVMNSYGSGLNAPNEYFGKNWDAFRDCLMDLDWIEELNIHIIHGDVPVLGKLDRKIYLEILLRCVRDWSSERTNELAYEFPEFIPHKLFVYFRDSDKGLLAMTLRDSPL